MLGTDVQPRRSGSRLTTLTLVCALVLLAVPAPPAVAVAGMLDPSFGTGGTVETSLPGGGEMDPYFSEANAVTTDDSGRILVAGASTYPYPADSGFGLETLNFLVVRYHSNGAVDQTFMNPWGEAIVTDLSGDDDRAMAVAVQPDGRILAAGSATVDGVRHFALVRYLEDGTLDTTFGAGGTVITAWPGNESQIEAMLVQPNGRIVVAGWSQPASGTEISLARYREDGTLDGSFAEGGRASLAVDGAASSAGLDLTRQPNGRLLVAGRAGSDLALARFLGNGNLDVGFGVGGTTLVTVGVGGSVANGVRVRADGGIVVAGSSVTEVSDEETHNEGDRRDLTLVSYLSDGSLDPWFGINSVVTRDVTGQDDHVRGLEIDGQGRLLVASAGLGRFNLTRFLPHGDIDPTFGDGGSTSTAPAGARTAQALTLQADGKVVVVGSRTNPSGFLGQDLALARFLITTSPALGLDIVVTPRREPIDSILGSARDPGSGHPVPGVRLRFLVDGEVVGIADTDEHGHASVPLPRRGLNATSVVRIEIVGDDGRDAGGVEARYHPRTGIDTRGTDDGGGARKLGFTLEGTRRRSAIEGATGEAGTERMDMHVWGLLPGELT